METEYVVVIKNMLNLFLDSLNDENPITVDTTGFIFALLKQVMNENISYLDIVPISSGGIQVEWHQNGSNFKVDINRTYELKYLIHTKLLNNASYSQVH